jgi:hypothetical protein
MNQTSKADATSTVQQDLVVKETRREEALDRSFLLLQVGTKQHYDEPLCDRKDILPDEVFV